MRDNDEAGFSLLEITIVLIILGIMGSVMLPGFMAQQQSQKNQITREHQERIFHALALYLQIHGRLPCPADSAQKGAERGMAREKCLGSMAQGLLPFRTLGLSETFAKDGHRRFFTYAVHPTLTSLKLSKFCGQSLGKELVVTEEGKPLQGQGEQDRIAIVLVSHGPSREGSVSACKQENTNGDLVFCARPSKDQTGSFNDQIRWETRFNFSTYYAKTPCIDKK